MGVVYRATDPELGRTVALKLIAPERAADPTLRELFVRESLTAARLEHPNVIPIYRAGEDEGQLFIAMRFVEGASLQDLIAGNEGGIPPGRAARIVARVAEALDAAHASGLVHRDVKPANILIADPDGEEHVYLTDFGLSVPTSAGARPAAEAAAGPGRSPTSPPSRSTAARSTRAPTSTRSDACSSTPSPGARPSPPATSRPRSRRTSRSRRRRPHRWCPGLPPAMDEVVQRAMAKRPEDRFASAGELGRAALSARYDVALLAATGDGAAAGIVADGLAEAGLHPARRGRRWPGGGRGRARLRRSCAVVVGREGLGDWARAGLSAARELAVRDRAFRLALVLLPGAPDPADPSLAYLATHPWVDLRAGRLRRPGGRRPGPGAARRRRAGRPAGRQRRVPVPRPRGLPRGGRRPLLRPRAGHRPADRATALDAVRRGARPVGQRQELARARRPAARGPPRGDPGRRGLARGRDPSPASTRSAPSRRRSDSCRAPVHPPPPTSAPTSGRSTSRSRPRLEGRPAGERVMVLVDQLEEAFTLCTDEGERAAFLGNLVYAATIPGGRVVVVVSMRADFYHRLAEHPELRALVASHQHLVGPMDARGAAPGHRGARPPRRARAGAGPHAADPHRRLRPPGHPAPARAPPRRALAAPPRPDAHPRGLRRLGRRRGRARPPGQRGLRGDAARAPGRSPAGSSCGSPSPGRAPRTRAGAPCAPSWSRGPRRSRRSTPCSTSLTEARLVTAGRDPASGEPVVEVTHEALIRGWPELRGWIDEDRDRLRAERRLSDAAVEWERGGREDGALYRGARLLAWQERDRSALNPTERRIPLRERRAGRARTRDPATPDADRASGRSALWRW